MIKASCRSLTYFQKTHHFEFDNLKEKPSIVVRIKLFAILVEQIYCLKRISHTFWCIQVEIAFKSQLRRFLGLTD